MYLKVQCCEVTKGSNLRIANGNYNPRKLPKGCQDMQKNSPNCTKSQSRNIDIAKLMTNRT
jgi:hypothetical protein